MFFHGQMPTPKFVLHTSDTLSRTQIFPRRVSRAVRRETRKRCTRVTEQRFLKRAGAAATARASVEELGGWYTHDGRRKRRRARNNGSRRDTKMHVHGKARGTNDSWERFKPKRGMHILATAESRKRPRTVTLNPLFYLLSSDPLSGTKRHNPVTEHRATHTKGIYKHLARGHTHIVANTQTRTQHK